MLSHGSWGLAGVISIAALALSGAPPVLAAQSTDDRVAEAAAIARADSARAELVQPPATKPHPAASVVRAPFRAFGGMLAVAGGVGYGAYSALDRTGVVGAAQKANRALKANDVKVRPAYIGTRSGSALVARWNGSGTPLFAEAGYSLRGYSLLRGGLSVGDTLYGAELSGGYHKLTQIHYWGLGPGTPVDDRSDYGYVRKDVAAGGHARIAPHVRVGVEAGWEQDEGRRGTDGRNPDVQDAFADVLPFGALGTDRYGRLRGDVDVDFTRVGPTYNQLRGVRMTAEWSGYRGVSGTTAGFQRGRGDVRVFWPLSKQHAIALRGLAEEIFAQTGAGVPLYHVPALGGSQGLRGQKGFRYRDLALLAAQGEWRYQVWWHPGDPGYRLDAFAFVDHGAVGPSLRSIASDDFITTPGLGFRFMSHGVGKVETFLAFGGDKPRAGLKLGTTF